MKLRSLLSLVLLLVISVSATGAELRVGNFSAGELDGWEEKSFVGNTRYALVDSEHGKVLEAKTEGMASGLFRELSVDLDKTPYLNWSWRVDNTFKDNDERSKAGDDYPARIYVVVSGGVFFWKTRAINYVWSSNQAQGSAWPNAYTGNARMMALRSGKQELGNWVQEKRNVREDLKAMFGKDLSKIDAVALMVDGDNTGQSASARFGDIWFSAE